MKLFCCFLMFAFFLRFDSVISKDPGGDRNSTEKLSISSPTNDPQPADCDCFKTCDETSILPSLYARLMGEKDKIKHAKYLLHNIQGWVETWESENGGTKLNTPPTEVGTPPTVMVTTPTTTTTSESISELVPTNQSNVTNATAPPTNKTDDAPLAIASNPPTYSSKNQPPIETTTRQTVTATNTSIPHFYQSTFFFVLIFFSIMIVFSIYFCYVSRRKVSYLRITIGKLFISSLFR